MSNLVISVVLTGIVIKAQYPLANESKSDSYLDWESVNTAWSLWNRWQAQDSSHNESILVIPATDLTEMNCPFVEGTTQDGIGFTQDEEELKLSSSRYPESAIDEDDLETYEDYPEISSLQPDNKIDEVEFSVGRVPSNQNRIVGGHAVQIHQHPYMAQIISLLKNGRGIFCGGTIIGNSHVLTAGHCVTLPSGHLAKPRNLLVRLGATNISCGGELAPVSKVYRHPKYSPLSNRMNGAAIYDLAILRLKKPIKFSDTVAPVALATSEDTDKLIKMAYTNVPCQVLGWGWTKAGMKLDSPGMENTMSKTLMATTVHLVDWTECRVIVPILEINAEICCSSPHTTSACKGDSGGPLICGKNKEYGLVSRGTGSGCGIPNLPYIYTRIDTLHKYISDIMRSHW